MRFYKLATLTALLLAAVACSTTSKVTDNTQKYDFPTVDQKGKVAIIAHRGFWNSEQGGMSENSIASLKAAQDAGFWGSECDIHITADDVVIVNHNDDIEGKKIASSTFAELSGFLLPNGERRPTLDEYLDQAAKCKTTRLIIEFKAQPSQEREDLLVNKTMAALKAHNLYDPEQILFISFSKHICLKVAAEHPQFVNQFLTANVVANENPAKYANAGINGADYYFKMFSAHPEWVRIAHEKGMSVNAWTVNEEKDMRKMIDVGVDAITTNFPLTAREILGDKECK